MNTPSNTPSAFLNGINSARIRELSMLDELKTARQIIYQHSIKIENLESEIDLMRRLHVQCITIIEAQNAVIIFERRKAS